MRRKLTPEELEKEAMKCQHCGGKITQTPWNTRGDVLVCMNTHCVAYRRPVGHVSIELSFNDLLNKMYGQASDLKVKHKGGKLWRL